MEKISFDELEDVNFDIDKKAFEPESLTCSECISRMMKDDFKMGRSLSFDGDILFS